jgi:RNA polymerase sigma-70 factor, ECF subfamily
MPRNTSVPDARLVRRSQQGDRRAFRALLTRYDRRLRGLAHALLLDPERVDAVLRVAYVRAWREVVRIDPRQNAAAWLYRLVYNACIDGLRRESTRIGAAPPTAPDVPDTVDAEAAADAVVASADPPDEPEPAGSNGDRPATMDGRQAQVVEALATLAPADRVAVVLVDREGFAPETAARILGLTPEVLETRVVGARARLTKQLADVLAAPATPTAPAEEAAPAEEENEPESRPEEAEPEADTQAQSEEPQPDARSDEAQSDEPQSEPEQPEGDQPELEQPELEQPEPEQPEPEQQEAELDDAASAETAETKVASRSAAGGSPNGSSGGASTNGSDDAGGGAS